MKTSWKCPKLIGHTPISFRFPEPYTLTFSSIIISNSGLPLSNLKQPILLACPVDFRLNLIIKLINLLLICISGWRVNNNCHIKELLRKSSCYYSVVDYTTVKYRSSLVKNDSFSNFLNLQQHRTNDT